MFRRVVVSNEETKGQTFGGIPGVYSTNGALVDYCIATNFSTHPVAVKCEVFTTTGTREYKYAGARPATHLKRSLLLPANRTQSIANALKSKSKGSILNVV